MSEVKRWDIDQHEGEWATMGEDTRGDYVLASDYDQIKAASREMAQTIIMLRADKDALVEAISEVVGCFDAAEIEGWSAAVQSGDFDSIRDLWHRRISFAYFAASEALAAYHAAMGSKGDE